MMGFYANLLTKNKTFSKNDEESKDRKLINEFNIRKKEMDSLIEIDAEKIKERTKNKNAALDGKEVEQSNEIDEGSGHQHTSQKKTEDIKEQIETNESKEDKIEAYKRRLLERKRNREAN